MDGINYPEEKDINNLFLNESQVRIVNKISNLMSQYSNNILDYDDDVPFIDCKYYSADSFKYEIQLFKIIFYLTSQHSLS